MATRVWFIPGFMGSTLGLYRSGIGQPTLVAPVWGTLSSIPNLPLVNYLTLPGLFGSGSLFIQPDGIASSDLGGYSQFLFDLVGRLPINWALAPWPYDWRLSARDTGLQLALQLITSKDAGNDNRVLAHSQGALVAWVAWAELVARARTDALSRLVTFGGALYGTNSTPSIFLGLEDSLGLLARLRSLLIGLRNGNVGNVSRVINVYSSQQTGALEASNRELLNVVRTWPAIYDLYPDVSMLDDPKDVDRPLLSDPTKWVSAFVQPNFTLMNAEFDNVHRWLRTPANVPPANRAAHIVGLTTATPWRVRPSQYPPTAPQQIGGNPAYTFFGGPWFRPLLPSWTSTTRGDGRCTEAQQGFPSHYTQSVASQHAAMQDDPAVRLLIPRLLQMDLVPVPPTPNPAEHANPWVPPPALPSVPTFLFNNDPVSVTATTPSSLALPPVRIGGDP